MRSGLALLAGVLLPYAWVDALPGAALVGLVLLAALLLAAGPRWRAWALLPLGLAAAEWQLQQRMLSRLPPALAGEVLEVRGQVSGLPERQGRALRFVLALEAPAQAPALRRIRLAWYEGAPDLRAGDRVALRVKLKRPRGWVNPAGFDGERHALLHGMDASGYVLRALGPAQPGWSLDRIREAGSDRLAAVLGATPSTGLLQALVYGDTRALSDADWQRFRQTGTTHLIAISGSHIGMVALAMAALVAWLWGRVRLLQRWPRRIPAALAGALAAFGYCLLAGFAVPAQRTMVGLTTVALALLWRRQLSAWAGLHAALVAVLLYDPLAVLAPGFWLSFGAVAALVLIFAGRRPAPVWWRALLEAQWKLGVVLLPLGAWLFQVAAPLALPTNLWAVPLVSALVVPVALLGTALSAVPWLGEALLGLAAVLADAFLWGVQFSVRVLDVWPLAPPSPWVVLLGVVGALWLIAPRGVPARILGGILLLPLVWPAAPLIAPGRFEMWVFDVGQGLSVLVRTARHSLLYDTGPGREDGEPVAALSVLPSLARLGVWQLDHLVLSHGDDDHAGGAARVLQQFPRAQVWSSDGRVGASPCLADTTWNLDGVQLSFLHPDPGLPYLGNRSSCVLRIAGLDGVALLPGDIDQDVEQRLLNRRADRLPAQVLVSPHHGSGSSSSTAFIAAVAPQWVIHASGFQDRFGFPRAPVVARYAAAGAQQIDTGSAGAVRVYMDAQSGRWQVEALRVLIPRRWREPGARLEP